MIGIDERISYYIGNTKFDETIDGLVTEGYDKPIKLRYESYAKNNAFRSIHPGTMYFVDVARLLYHSDTPKYVQCGDSCYDGNGPVFTKVRTSETGGILFNLNSTRHWKPIVWDDISWEQKSSDIVWRGSDTGQDTRLNFVKSYYSTYNVGFSGWVQDKHRRPGLYRDDYLKSPMSVSDMLTYKYLPVVNGNDKSSSLGWVMASNSVPIMPVPKFHSWMCEKWLVPGEHYVEVKDDFFDFDEKVQWCKEHDDECRKIATNGREFMLQFANEKRELYIEKKLISMVDSHSSSV